MVLPSLGGGVWGGARGERIVFGVRIRRRNGGLWIEEAVCADAGKESETRQALRRVGGRPFWAPVSTAQGQQDAVLRVLTEPRRLSRRKRLLAAKTQLADEVHYPAARYACCSVVLPASRAAVDSGGPQGGHPPAGQGRGVAQGAAKASPRPLLLAAATDEESVKAERAFWRGVGVRTPCVSLRPLALPNLFLCLREPSSPLAVLLVSSDENGSDYCLVEDGALSYRRWTPTTPRLSGMRFFVAEIENRRRHIADGWRRDLDRQREALAQRERSASGEEKARLARDRQSLEQRLASLAPPVAYVVPLTAPAEAPEFRPLSEGAEPDGVLEWNPFANAKLKVADEGMRRLCVEHLGLAATAVGLAVGGL